jgi:hypothetical protein
MRETGTGQQVAQSHNSCMMTTMMAGAIVVFMSNIGSTTTVATIMVLIRHKNLRTQKLQIMSAYSVVDFVWNLMAHAQKPDFVCQRNGRVHLNRRGRQFSRLLAAEVCASAVVMLDTPCSEVVWRVLATHSIRQFPLQFPTRASPCAITFQLDSTEFNYNF